MDAVVADLTILMACLDDVERLASRVTSGNLRALLEHLRDGPSHCLRRLPAAIRARRAAHLRVDKWDTRQTPTDSTPTRVRRVVNALRAVCPAIGSSR